MMLIDLYVKVHIRSYDLYSMSLLEYKKTEGQRNVGTLEKDIVVDLIRKIVL